MPDSMSVAAPQSSGDDTIGSAPNLSERSSLTAHADSTVAYGATTPSSSSHTDVDTDSTDESPFGSKYHDDEEALLAAPPSAASGADVPLPALSTKALLWIIAPMLLGSSLLDGLRIPAGTSWSHCSEYPKF